ncbi:hypothetical protein ABPG72_007854 [Tetrahymena utriculariae]
MEKFKKVLLILTIFFINLVQGGNLSLNQTSKQYIFIGIVEQLISLELNGVFTEGQVQWVNNNVFVCTKTDYSEFQNQSVMGIFGQGLEESQKTFSNLPPHWSASIRLDLILYRSLDRVDGDCIEVSFDGQNKCYTKETAISGVYLCNEGAFYKDELVLYHKNVTHQKSSIVAKLKSKLDEDRDNEGYAFKNVHLFVDTCHDSCKSCNGPTENQCESCPTNSKQTGSTCQCNSGYYAHNNSCVNDCPGGYRKDTTGKLCVLDFCFFNCNTCENESGQCLSCQTGYFLIDGQCVAECPSYSISNVDKCEDLKSKKMNGSYLLKSMFDAYFGESEVIGAGILTSGFLGYTKISSGAYTTLCGDKIILGGAYLSSQNAFISRSFTGLQPHWQVTIGYTLYKIDQWNNQSVQLIVDGSIKETTIRSTNDGDSNICGNLKYNDQIIKISRTFTHDSSSLSLKIKSNLRGSQFDKSFGIRELYVLVDYCSSICEACNAYGCTKCNSSYYLYNLQCVDACPNGYAPDLNKECKQCDPSCQTCSSPLSSTSCLSCKDNANFLNPNKSCISSCPSKYWGNTDNHKCESCDSNCYNCQSPGDQLSCTSCSGTKYLFGNTCQTNCPSGTFKFPCKI